MHIDSSTEHKANSEVSPIAAQSEEKILEARFARERSTQREVEEIQLEYRFTRDPELLQQYYILRQELYTKVWKLKGFNGLEDEFDKRCHTVLATHDKQVVAGSRLVVSTPRNRQPLPMEQEGVDVTRYFPDIKTKELSYGEGCRTVVLPEYSRYHCTSHMFAHIYRKARALGVDYVFTIAPKPVTRAYSLASKALGFSCRVVEECTVEAEDESAVVRKLMVWDIPAIAHETQQAASEGVVSQSQKLFEGA